MHDRLSTHLGPGPSQYTCNMIKIHFQVHYTINMINVSIHFEVYSTCSVMALTPLALQ